MQTLLQLYRKWRLRQAEEKYAYWKARHAALIELHGNNRYTLPGQAISICRAAAQTARFEVRVERLMRG